jgi:arylsulfatase A-like enzyme
VPYATPIPLVFSWPARWGDEAVVVDEVVSNIDLAPTLCAIGGCEMGPYPGGPETADGLSLLPLLDGEADHLERIVVREQGAPDGYGSAPRFWAIRTTSQHPLGRYHYIEYQTGETELYDSVEDPWEISNLATADAYAEVVARLAEDLRVEFPSLP